MMNLIVKINQTATNVMDMAVPSVNNDIAHTAVGHIYHSFNFNDPVVFTLWGIAFCTVLTAIYVLMTERPYKPRRIRRKLGEGPLMRLYGKIFPKVRYR